MPRQYLKDLEKAPFQVWCFKLDVLRLSVAGHQPLPIDCGGMSGQKCNEMANDTGHVYGVHRNAITEDSTLQGMGCVWAGAVGA